MTRARRVLVGLVLAGLVALALVALGLFPQDPGRRRLESRLQEALGPRSRVGALAVRPGGLSAEARDVVLEGPTYRLEIDRLQLAVSPATLWGAGLDIRRAEIDGARVVIGPAGEAGAARAPVAGPVLVRQVRVTNATLVYRDPARAGDIVVRGVEAHGSVGVGEGTFEIRMAGGTWPGTPPVPLGPGTARLRVSPGLDAQLDSFEAGLPRSRLRASGRLGPLWSPDLDVRFEGAVELAEIEDRGGIAPARGAVRAEGSLRGPLAALKAEARLATDGASVHGWSVESGTGRLTYDAAEPGRADATVDVAVLGGRGHLDARLVGTSLRGRVTGTRLDAARLLREAGAGRSGLAGRVELEAAFEGERPETGTEGPIRIDATVRATGALESGAPARLEARASGPVHLGGAGPRVDLEWTAVLESRPGEGILRDARVTLAGTARGALPPVMEGTLDGSVTTASGQVTVPLALTGTFRSEGAATRARLEARGLGAPAFVSADLRGAVARAVEVRADAIDLALVVPGTTGRARVQLSASGPLAALSGGGTVTVEGLVARGIDVGAVDLHVAATRGAADVTLVVPALAVRGELRARAGGAAELAGTLHLADTPLAPFGPLLPEGRSLEGRVRGSVELRVPFGHPAAAVALARVESLEVASGALRAESRGPFRVELRGGDLTLRDLALAGPGITLAAEGSLGTAPASALDLTARAAVDLAQLPVREGWSLTGTARADVTLSGSRRQPLVHGTVDLGGVALASSSLPALAVEDGRIELRGDALAIPGLTARAAEGTITLSGLVPLAAVWTEARRDAARPATDEQARLVLSWKGIQAEALARQFRPTGAETFQGTLAGEAEVQGGLASLAEVQGLVRLAATQVRVQELPLELDPATLHLESGRLSTDAVVVRTAGGSLRVAGHADLVRRDVDLRGAGKVELRALSPFLTEAALTGGATLDLAVRGTLDAPRPEGSLTVHDGTLRLRALPQALTGIHARLVFDRTAIRLAESRARLGGGDVTLSGEARLLGTRVEGARVVVTGRDIALAYPAGMRTRLDADLALTGATGAFLLGGTVKATRGLYDLDVALEQSLTARVAEATDSPLLRSIALDVRVETPNPVLVRNNLAQLQATGQLTVRGDAQSPAPLGTLEIAPGGKVFLQGREFVIQSGRLTYQGTWDPTLAVTATSAKPIQDIDRRTGLVRTAVEVTVSLGGTLEKPGIALRSTPSYSERELVNLIASGDSQDPGALEAIGGQSAALLAGRLSRSLRGLGFDEVSIQPELVAREGGVEPGARFTFAKRITSRANLLYSLSLQDPEGRFVQLEATPGRDVNLTVQRTDAGVFTYGAGQRFRFGGPARARPPGDERVRLSEVRLEGDRPLEPAEMMSWLGTRAGDRRTIWDLQDRAERLRQRLMDRGYVEAEVGARLERTVAVFQVRSGARYRWRVLGLSDPPDLGDAVRGSLFEEEALERGRARLLAGLHDRGHLRAVVAARTVSEGDARTLLFTVDPGPRIDRVEVRFAGASARSHAALRAAAGGAARLLTDPDGAVRDIVAAYRQRQYLAAHVERPRVEESARGVVIKVPIREGDRARVGAVRFAGSTQPEEELLLAAGILPGTEIEEAEVAAAVDRLRAHFFRRGYAAVRINSAIEARGDALDVVFQVAEGRRRTVGEVVIRGLRRTRESLVRRETRLRPGRPLDPRELVAIERRLLDLGVFARATVEASDEDPATITVSVEEGDRLIAGYVLRYDDEDGSRADLDGELRNLFGTGLAAGARYGLGRDLRDLRGVLSLPALFRLGRLTASAFRLEEDLPSDFGEAAAGPQNVRRQEGGQIQLTRRLGRRWDALAGYRFKRTRLLPVFPDPIDIAALDLSLLRDTRDSTLDARRGGFWSFSLEYSPAGLGSDFTFVKGLAQVFAMRPLNGSLTWAQGARLGLAHGFRGQRLTSTERFRAGGANTLRGFATDAVGPRDAFGDPTGGESVVVLNEELRYHHRSGLGAVVFYDAGNVFESAADLDLDWRHAVGLGLRWASPVGLLRLDVGVPVSPRPGEKRPRYFVSLGQAF